MEGRPTGKLLQQSWRERTVVWAIVAQKRSVKSDQILNIYEYIWRVDPIGFPDGLDVGFERKRSVKGNSKVYSFMCKKEVANI